MSSTSDFFEARRTAVNRWAMAAVVAVALHMAGAAAALIQWKESDAEDAASAPFMIELSPLPVASRMDTPDVATGPLMEEAMLTPEAAKQTREEIIEELPRVEESPAPEPEVALPTPKEQKKKTEEVENKDALPAQENPTQTAAAPLTTAPPRVEAEASSAAAAPSPGISRTPSQAEATWQKALVSHLNKFKRYPHSARLNHSQGEVGVEFTLDRGGRVTGVSVTRSSGVASLDEEAVAMLHRASPLPVPPAALPTSALHLNLPVQFRIR
jgi:periplasmic protein TonB